MPVPFARAPRLLLANPPFAPRDKDGRFGVRAGSRWPFTMAAPSRGQLPYVPFPFFLAQGAALLAREGFEVLAVDAVAEGLADEAYLARVETFAPDVLLAETSAASLREDQRFLRATRELLPQALLLLAGPHVSADPLGALTTFPEADACLLGEYEATLLEIALALREGDLDLGIIQGLSFRDGAHGGLTGRRAPLDVNALPWPAWEQLPMAAYKDPFCGVSLPMANMLASRGCPHRCNFCLWPTLMYGGTSYRVRDPEDTADELAALVERYAMRTIYFDDDTFNLGRARTITLARAIQARQTGADLAVMARADAMVPDVLEALVDAGLTAVKYGIESGAQELVSRCGKGLDLAQAAEAVKRTKAAGVKVHLTFALGLPGETEATIDKTIDYALALAPDSLQISLATPFPGTEYYEEAKAAGHLLADDATLYDGAAGCVVRTEALTCAEIEAGLARFRAAWAEHKKMRAHTGTEAA